jgi:hypothetical protein
MATILGNPLTTRTTAEEPDPPATPWYLAGEVSAANCIAAYQPKGAASLAASYVNLANPGTYNAAPGVAPAFDTAAGWTFDGATKYLTTGVTPANRQTWSFIVRFTGQTNAGAFFGQHVTNGPSHRILGNADTDISYRNTSSTSVTVAPGLSAAVLAMAGSRAYRNGDDEGQALPEYAGATAPLAMFIGGRNLDGALASACNATIIALAFYDAVLTAPQVAAITAAMAAL